ncbi:MAG: hypothetical protein JJE47_08720 [Acidimicrobiia bacterium]|nr:hypothetical protein [Acidimicrobiia bacterium]
MTEAISFTGSRGTELVGIFYRPDRDVRAGMVMAHCFTCSKDLSDSSRIAAHPTRRWWLNF